jgi:hypothetical protein
MPGTRKQTCSQESIPVTDPQVMVSLCFLNNKQYGEPKIEGAGRGSIRFRLQALRWIVAGGREERRRDRLYRECWRLALPDSNLDFILQASDL